MNAKELAKMLDGRQYMDEVTERDRQLAKENGLVIVYGYSDDNAEFDGAIYDEVGCFNGRTINLDRRGKIIDFDDFPGGYVGNLYQIEAVWCDKEIGASWSYRTDIPHETFNVYEDDELFCVGIVFSLEDLK